MTDILVIPDCHSTPFEDGDRFEWLGHYILEQRPDKIVVLGDFLDMASISSHDRGKLKAEARRIKLDKEWGQKHTDRLFSPVVRHNKARKARKKSRYLPEVKWLGGNHEYRLDRFIEQNPELAGALDIDLQFPEELDVEVVPFLEPCFVEGVCFTHFLPNAMGRAFGGKNAARTILLESQMSVVVGHSHKWDISLSTRKDGTKMFGLVAGWYGYEGHDEDWSRGTDHAWVNGVTLLKGVKDGAYRELQFTSQEVLKERYA